MGKFFNKIRQVFNIFLIMLLIAAATAVFTYFLTTPEQRGVTFWISAGFLAFAMILETLMFSGIAMRSNNGRNVPVSFTKVILGGLYFLFVIVVSVGNALADFSVVKYMLIHVGGLVVFLVPMILVNMAELRLSGSDRKQQAEGRQKLADLSRRVGYVADDLKASGLPAQNILQIVRLSEGLKYSDPTPAPGRIERSLEEAVMNLEEAAKTGDVQEITRMCTLAERTLRERDEAVLSAK
ncbi:MAG: hypothetical protein IJS39_01955 [Synergistaceae bacterium]|nr:hypothetical protein [Synergistaceae bacterium]